MHDTPTASSIQVNGRSEPLGARTLARLLEAKGIESGARGIAVALNGAVVPRAAWPRTPLHAGDAVEIVHAKQGG